MTHAQAPHDHFYALRPWANLSAAGPAARWVDVPNCHLDRSLVPVWDGALCVDRMHHSYNKFINHICGTSPIFDGARFVGHGVTLARPPQPTRHVAGRSVLVGSVGNFGHFLCNHLPRLAAAERLGWGDWDHVVIGPAARYALDACALLGVPRDKILAIEGEDVVRFDSLTLLPMSLFIARSDGAVRATGDFPGLLRQRLHQPSEKRLRLYLPRGQARWRRLLNEDEVIAALQPYGFTLFPADKLSLAEQIAMVGAADYIVSPGGAAEAIVLFAPSGAKLIELGHEHTRGFGDWSDAVFGLAGAGLHKILGQAVDAPDTQPWDRDFTVDPQAVIAEILRPTRHMRRVRRADPASVEGAPLLRAMSVSLTAPRWEAFNPDGRYALAVKVANAAVDRSFAPIYGQTACLDLMLPDPAGWLGARATPIFSGAGFPPHKLVLGGAPTIKRTLPGLSALIGSCDDLATFLIHYAPRLALIKAMGQTMGLAVDHYLVGPTPAFVVDAVRRAGLDPAGLVALGEDEILAAERLLLTPMLCGRRFEEGAWTLHPSFPHQVRALLGRFAPQPHGRVVLTDAAGDDPDALNWRTTPLPALLDAVGAAAQLHVFDGAGLALALFAATGARVATPAALDLTPTPWFKPAARAAGLTVVRAMA